MAAAPLTHSATNIKRSHRMVVRDGRGRGVGRAFHMLPMPVSGSMTIASGTNRVGKARATGFKFAVAADSAYAAAGSAHGIAPASQGAGACRVVAAAADRIAASGGSSAGGDWICFQHAGQGPQMPATLSGTLSLMPQAGQWKIRESVAMVVTAIWT